MSKKITRPIFFIGIFLFFLELASRFYLFGFDCFNYAKIDSVHYTGVSGLIRASANSELLFELIPNLDTYLKLAKFTTNSQGLRDKERTIVKPEGTFRVAVVGASVVMGSGVNYEDTFCSILEKKLNSEAGSVVYECINFGVGGYQVRQILASLKYRALEYSPDLVLFCWDKDGKNLNAGRNKSKKFYTVKPRSHPFFESFFLKLLAANKVTYRFKKNLDKNQKAHKDILVELNHVFRQIKEISLRKQIPVVIVIVDIYPDDPSYYKKVEELSRAYGLHFIDTSVFFKDKCNLGKFIIYNIDRHPNKEAQKIFAETIFDYLKKNVLRAPVARGAMNYIDENR